MNAHLRWIGAAAIVAAGWDTHSASAQYAPYRPQQQLQPSAGGYPSTGQPAVTTAVPAPPQVPISVYRTPAPQAYLPQAQQLPAAAPAAMTRYAVPAVAAAPRYPQTAAQIPAYSYPYPQVAQAPSYAAAAAAGSATWKGYPTYPQVAQQPSPPEPANGEAMPAPTPAAPDQSVPAPVDQPATDAGAAAANGGAAAVNGGAYPSTGYDMKNGYSGYGQGSYGTDYGVAAACEPSGGGHVWFGGIYALAMERDNPSVRKLTVRVDHDAAAEPYYPPSNTTVLSTHETDFNFQEGVEVRFGSTFSIGSSCDEGCGHGYGYGAGCGGNCAPVDEFAWEIGWWGIDEDSERASYGDPDWTDAVRCYGMVNFVGLVYSDGIGDQPVNEYYGYNLPILDPADPNASDLVVVAQRTRSSFSCQNLELNLIRFPVCGMGCGNSCGSNCGAPGCGSGCGYDAYGCEPKCTPVAFSMYGMCGVRYFRADDDFYYGSQWTDATLVFPPSWINYDINVDNNLFGPQVGWTMNYCVGSHWNFFWNSTFGIFNNHIESHQRVWGDNGNARYAQTGEAYIVDADKDDVSFLGELRVGGSYDISCNWRAVLAYRAVAITGFANSIEQIPTDFTNAEYAGIIDSNSSLIVHGAQLGVECRY